jgi:hypothetical protein
MDFSLISIEMEWSYFTLDVVWRLKIPGINPESSKTIRNV